MSEYRRKTKIICTIGPASCDKDVLEKLMLAGMDVARFNFSHGDYDTFEKWFSNITEVRNKLGIPVATLLDTKGPEIRIGSFENESGIVLKRGQKFTLTTEEVVGNHERCSVSFKGLAKEVKKGTTILIDDGLIALEVAEIKNNDIVCKVIDGGVVTDHKGVNVPMCHFHFRIFQIKICRILISALRWASISLPRLSAVPVRILLIFVISATRSAGMM